MKQKKLYRTIETVDTKKFATEADLIKEVTKQIVQNEQIKVSGGRIWKLDTDRKAYCLLFQTGNVNQIPPNFEQPLNDYPIFEEIAKERTVLADETNKVLIEKGIFKYSAAGVGSKIKVNGKLYYQYMIAVNSDAIDDELRYTLNIIATALTAKLRERRLSISRKSLMEDLDKAKQLQKSILPEHELSFYNYELFGVTIPAQILGGDFFDYLSIGDDEDRMGIVVGDAASKGLAAAAEAMYISGAIRMASTFQIKISPFMYRINELVNKIFSDDKFITLFYGEISKDKKGLFLYANAGHNPPMFICAKEKKVQYLESTGPLLGPAPHSRYETASINFNPGDVLVVYSDGITEAANDKYDFYEEGRLEEVVKKNIHKSPKEIAHSILDDVIKFSTDESQYQDDKTVVVIKRKAERQDRKEAK